MIIYATNSGGTRLVAQEIQRTLESLSLTVSLHEASHVEPQMLDTCDAIILGSCTWDYEGQEGQVHKSFKSLQKKLEGKKYSGKKTAIFALGDRSYLYYCEAAAQLETLAHALDLSKLGETLCINCFYHDQEQNLNIAHGWAVKLGEMLVS